MLGVWEAGNGVVRDGIGIVCAVFVGMSDGKTSYVTTVITSISRMYVLSRKYLLGSGWLRFQV